MADEGRWSRGRWRRSTISGIRWSGAASLIGEVTQFAIMVALARILGPEAFGLIGMILVFSGFAHVFGELGFGAALVQRETLEPRHWSSVFWLNASAGLVLTALFAAGSPLVAAFYDEPMLVPLMLALSVQFALAGVATVHRARLQRAMDFRKLSLIQVTVPVLAGGVAIGLALSGFGVWSLVGQSLFNRVAQTLALWAATRWVPAPRVDWSAIGDLWTFSSNLLGFRLLNYGSANLDNLIIGKLIGAEALGIYGRAYGVMLKPVQRTTTLLNSVMFPSLSRVKHDVALVRAVYTKSIRVIALVSVPMYLGLIGVADPFVRVVYGTEWLDAVPVIQILCIAGTKQPVGATCGWLYTSQGRTDLQFKWGIIKVAALVPCLLVGSLWGLNGVAWGFVVQQYAMWWWSITVPYRLVDLRFRDALAALGPPVAIGGVMLAAVFGTGIALAEQPPAVQLLVEVPVGVAVYAGLAAIVRPRGFVETLASLKTVLNRG